MFRYLTVLGILIIFGCCPPCDDRLTDDHRKILDCAGNYGNFVRANSECVFFVDRFEDNRKAGSHCDYCWNIFIMDLKVGEYPGVFTEEDAVKEECRIAVHEAAHLEMGSDDENYPLQKWDEFWRDMNDNNCQL